MHIGHVCRNLTAKEEIQKHRRDCQQQAATRCNERFSDPFGQVGRFGLARRERAEARNHPGDRAEQPDHRREHRKGVQVIHDHHHLCLGTKAIVSDGIFHRGLIEHVAFVVRLHEGRCERMSKRAGIGLAIFVGSRKVPPRDEVAKMRHDVRRHHLCLAVHDAAVGAERERHD